MAANPFDDTQGYGLGEDPFERTQNPDKYGRTFGEAAKDTGVAIAQGAVGLVKLVPMTVGLADTVISKAFGLGAPASGGALNNPLTRKLNEVEDDLQGKKSAYIQAKSRKSDESAQAYGEQFADSGPIAREAATWAAKIGNVVTSPSLLLDSVAQSAASILPAGFAANRVQAVAEVAIPKIATSMAKEAVEKAAARAGVAAGVATGAAQQGADVAGDTYERVMKMGDDMWAKNARYVELTKTMTPEKAKQQIAGELATEAGVKSGLVSLAVNGVGAKFGGAAAETAFLKRLESSPGGFTGAVKMGLKDAAGETVTESAEEGYGAYAQNIAAQQVDPSVDPLKGVGLAAGAGAAGGFGLGGAIGAMHGRNASGEFAKPSASELTNQILDRNSSIDDAIAAADQLTRRTDELSAAISGWKAQTPEQMAAVEYSPVALPSGPFAESGRAAPGVDGIDFTPTDIPVGPFAQRGSLTDIPSATAQNPNQLEMFDAREVPDNLQAFNARPESIEYEAPVRDDQTRDMLQETPTATLTAGTRYSAQDIDARMANILGLKPTVYGRRLALDVSRNLEGALSFLASEQEKLQANLDKLNAKLDSSAGGMGEQGYFSKRAAIESQMAQVGAAQKIAQEFNRERTQAYAQEAAFRPSQPTRTEAARQAPVDATVEQMTQKNLQLRQEAAIAESDARVEEARQRLAEQTRNDVLDRVLADPTTQNIAERFRAELQREGVRETGLTPREQERIAKFQEARDAFTAPDIAPSAPNEFNPYDGTVSSSPRAQPKVKASPVKYENRAVDPTALPRAGRDSVAPGEMTQQMYGALKQMARLVGKRIEVFENDSGRADDGFFDPKNPDVINLNRRSTRPHMVVLGHEIMHALRRENPQGYQAIVDVLKVKAKNEQGETYKQYYAGKAADLTEEMISDLGGNFFADSTFWKEVFAKVEERNGAGSKGIIARLSVTVRRVVREVMGVVEKLPGFRTAEWVQNLEEVRSAVSDAMADYVAAKRTAPEPTYNTSETTDATGQVERQGVVASPARGQDLPEQIDVDGKQRPTTNSNGQPIAATEEGVRNFWKWFGDSKVVDAEGRPLVLYHGTSAEFEQFDPDKGGGLIFLAPVTWRANQYAESVEGGKVVPAYARITNPATVRQYEAARRANRGRDARNLAKLDLQKEGFDGATDDITVIAFRPDQIKSAIGNSGEFDPSNPSILASPQRSDFRAARQTLADKVATPDLKFEIANNVRDQLADIIAPSKGFSRFSGINTQYHLAKKDPAFKRVFDRGQQYLNDIANFGVRAESLARTIFPGTSDALSDLGKLINPTKWRQINFGLKAAENEKVGRALSEGTLENGPSPYNGKVWTDQELRQKYGFSDREIRAYREARAAIAQSLTDYAKAEMAARVRTYATQGLTGQQRDAAIERLNEIVKDKSLAEAKTEFARMIAGNDSKGQGLKALNQLEQTANGLIRGGYAPLMRFGDFCVTGYDRDGNVKYFSMTDSMADARRQEAALKNDPEIARTESDRAGKKDHELFAGVSPETIALFAEAGGFSETEAFRQYADLATSSRSIFKRMLERKGTEGYSTDATRTLASFITSNSRRASSLLNGGEMTRAVQEMKSGANKDEAIGLVQYLQNPQEEASKIRGFMFFHYLGMSLGSGIVNLTQPVLMTAPYLSQWGIGNAKSAMASGMKDAAAFLRRQKVSDADLQSAMDRAGKEGVLDPNEIFQLMGAAQRGTRSFGWSKFVRIWGLNFQLSEAFNRTLTFASAYRVGRELTPEQLAQEGVRDAYEFATNAITETQGLYNKGNRPRWARGAIPATLFTFKQYSIGYMEFLTRLAGKNKKAFGLTLLMLLLAAGTSGMPGADDLDDVIDSIGNGMGYATNSKAWKTEVIREVFRSLGFGEKGAAEMEQIVQHGLLSYALPVDVSGRLGLGNLIPGTGLLNPLVRDKSQEALEVLGPAGSLGMNLIRAGEAAMAGDTRKLAYSIVPNAVRNFMQGYEALGTGNYYDAKGRLVKQVSTTEAVGKMVGLQPGSVAEASQTQDEFQGYADIVKYRQGVFNRRYAEAMIKNDSAELERVRADLAKWNAEHPDLPVRFNLGSIRQQVKQAKMTKEQRFIAQTPKQMRAEAAKVFQQAD